MALKVEIDIAKLHMSSNGLLTKYKVTDFMKENGIIFKKYLMMFNSLVMFNSVKKVQMKYKVELECIRGTSQMIHFVLIILDS